MADLDTAVKEVAEEAVDIEETDKEAKVNYSEAIEELNGTIDSLSEKIKSVELSISDILSSLPVDKEPVVEEEEAVEIIVDRLID